MLVAGSVVVVAGAAAGLLGDVSVGVVYRAAGGLVAGALALAALGLIGEDVWTLMPSMIALEQDVNTSGAGWCVQEAENATE